VVSAAPRTVLITGASGGVGRGIAIACGRFGWEVWIAARRRPESLGVAAEVDAAGGRGHYVECDVADRQSVVAALGEVERVSGRLDGLVHNATSGLSSRAAPLDEVPLAELQDHVAVTLRGTYLVALTAEPLLRASQGAFVAMTSEAAFEGKKLIAAYAFVKSAERGLLRSLAREWGPLGIRVNAVAPMAMTPSMERAFVSDPEMAERVLSRNPMGRIGDPTDDVGGVVAFLLSPAARYVNAQTLMIDGGSCPII
jgi:NAD(P)-dependent dehydrogenase (short-subunit alcohol dehydrogenase family)